MIRIACDHFQTKKNGTDHLGNPRVRCCLCGKSWIIKSARPLGDMRTEKSQAVMALTMMLEGCSVRTIHRLTGMNRKAIAALLLLIGERCQQFLASKIKNVQTSDIQVDELWAFIGCKEKFRQVMRRSEELGDNYTFLAIVTPSRFQYQCL